MIQINLYPRPIQENILQQVSLFFVVLVIISLGLAWYNSKLNVEVEALQAQIKYTQSKTDEYNATAQKVEEIKKTLTALTDKLAVIKILDQDRQSVFRMLDNIPELVIENRMWLTNFSIKQEVIKKKKKVKKRRRKKKDKDKPAPPEVKEKPKRPDVEVGIKGIAVDNDTIADFMKSLEDHDIFEAVRIKISQHTEFDQGKDRDPIPLMEFELLCKETPPKKLMTDKKPKKTDKK